MFGLLFSLKSLTAKMDPSSTEKGNLGVPQLPGQGCSFHSFRTNTYKLSFMETPSGIKSVKMMAMEIVILRRLDHPNVIKLEGIVTSPMSETLYLVFEYMDHDLAALCADNAMRFTESQVKHYMHQLFSGLKYCHENQVLPVPTMAGFSPASLHAES